MSVMVSNRRCSFGITCVKCSSELIAPELSEYRNERQVHHVWRCAECDCRFESLVSFPADHTSIKDIMTRRDVFPLPLVA
jgi:hypothetical protein